VTLIISQNARIERALNEPQSAYAKRFLRGIFDKAIAHAQPANFMQAAVKAYLPPNPKGRVIVVGAGKAAASMAAALEQYYDVPLTGVVVTRYGYGVPTTKIKVLEANHPVPDEASFAAGTEILAAVENLTKDDLVIALISGGGSALLCVPADGVTLADKQDLNNALLASGTPIQAMNCIRKHVSKIKGGKLAYAANPAQVISLLMSDIPGDDMEAIASGPTTSDYTTLKMARNYIKNYNIQLPASIVATLKEVKNETRFKCENTSNILVMTPKMVLEQVIRTIRHSGLECQYLGDALKGEASNLGRIHAELAIKASQKGKNICILSGGETTVTLNNKDSAENKGKGGRNTEYLLSLALHLKGAANIYALAGDTDGVDGSEDNAGAFITPDTLSRAKTLNLNLEDYLENNDSYSAFQALDDLVMTGPTMTNVNDFRAILVLSKDIK
jgi:glycerate 2-kinase